MTEVGDYRTVAGLLFPHRIEVGPKGSPERQRLVIRLIEVNPPLDDARFAMPGGRPASAASETACARCYPDARGAPAR